MSVNIKLQKYYLNMNPHVLRVHWMTRKYTTQNFCVCGGGGVYYSLLLLILDVYIWKICFLHKPAPVGLAVACCPTVTFFFFLIQDFLCCKVIFNK